MYGYIQSPFDPRDFIYKNMMAAVELPSSFFYDRIPVNKQTIGDCVGQSARAIKMIQEQKNHPGKNYDFAPDHVYVECKKRDGIPTQEGTHPKIAMAVLKDVGAARKGLFPDLVKHTDRPTASPEALLEAAQFKIGGYAKIQSVDEIKNALVNEGPIMAGVIVTESFVNAPKGVIPDPNGSWLGGHAICIDGYDDSKKMFRFINSWGNEWGDQGYGWLPYSFLSFRLKDIPMAFFQEAWSSVDMIMPNPEAQEVVLWLNRDTALVDGAQVRLDQAPVSQNGRTLVPLRFLSEVAGWNVDWEPVEKRIVLRR